MPVVEDDLSLAQLERILHSDTFRNSEALRRLLKFLADKHLSGEADQLKEYTVAVDGLGKPSTYDPRHDSTVRIQVGRLRAKLTEYYRAEGKDDSVVIDLRKGRFKLTCEQRLPTTVEKVAEKPQVRPRRSWLWLGLVVALALGIYAAVRLHQVSKLSPQPSAWTPALEELWGPFLEPNRPLLLVVEDPVFVELHEGPGIFYRDRSIHNTQDFLGSPPIKALRGALKNPDATLSHPYVAFGELSAVFLVGKFLGTRQQSISIVRSSEMSWQQLTANNVLFVGNAASGFYSEQLHGMPLQPELVPAQDGIRDVHPDAGEPDFYADDTPTTFEKRGTAYALVTHLPGPLGSNSVVSFSSKQPAAYVGAVRAFTEPQFAEEIVAMLKKKSGKLPPYYQVLIKVKFAHEIATETTVVLTRELAHSGADGGGD